MARRVLFLDIDGVLNRTGFRPRESTGLRSWIEPELARRLSEVLRAIGADIVMSSDWRLNRTLPQLREELHAATIAGMLADVTPALAGQPRWREIEAWMTANDVAHDSAVIVDDIYDMGDLAARFVRASPLTGLDDAAVRGLFGT
jgi:hypothetical protein